MPAEIHHADIESGPVLVVRRIVGALAPAGAAATLVRFEPQLSAWIQARESVLPVAMLLMLSAMVQPMLRRLFVVALCYGVAFLALRDSQHLQPLPGIINYDILIEVRPAVLIAIALLAGVAAVSETINPGTVWARRCYFCAAGIYFTGLGIISCGWVVTWQAVMLCITGLSAFVALFYAGRIVADENAEVEAEPDDDSTQRELEARHVRALRAKEWHDTNEPAI